MFLLVIIIKNLICQTVNRPVNPLKSGIVIGVEIIFSFFLYNIMIGRDNFGSLVSRVGVTLAFKVTHNLGRCLVEAFIGQNASLLFIITINYHNNIHGSDYQISRKNRSFQLLW